MFKKIFVGWILITSVYFITYAIVTRIFYFITGHSIFDDRYMSGIILGILLITIPYIAAGLYVRRKIHNLIGALWVCLVPMICERLIIYSVAYLLYINGGDGWVTPNVTLMGFIQGEEAPYFTTIYILMGLASLLLTLIISKVGKGKMAL